MAIDKESPLPIYYQIQQVLMEKIKSGELKPGEKIPSEHELCEQFDVSRMTIRQALNNLVKETYLYRKRGIGTFVQKPKAQGLEGLHSFTEDMRRQGLTPSSKLISFRKIKADTFISKQLELSQGADVYEIHRIRLANDEPITIEQAFIPSHILPNFTAENAVQSLYEYVEKETEHSLEKAIQEISAALANEEVAKWLNINEGDPILVQEQRTYVEEETPLEVVRSSYRADRYKFITQVERKQEIGE